MLWATQNVRRRNDAGTAQGARRPITRMTAHRCRLLAGDEGAAARANSQT